MLYDRGVGLGGWAIKPVVWANKWLGCFRFAIECAPMGEGQRGIEFDFIAEKKFDFITKKSKLHRLGIPRLNPF